MRKTVMIMAMLALAGCDAGSSKSGQAQPAQQTSGDASQAAPQQPAAAVVADPKWFIRMNSREAVSDTSAWLLERGYAPKMVVVDAKQEMLLGPYENEARAQEELTALQAKVAKSHRFTSPSLIQRAE